MPPYRTQVRELHSRPDISASEVIDRDHQMPAGGGDLKSYVCPSCHGPLLSNETGWHCLEEQVQFHRVNGIPDFILPARRVALENFLAGYQRVRRAEGWGSSEPARHRALPYPDHAENHVRLWEIRSQTFESFLAHFIRQPSGLSRQVLDIGAGNCWFAARLADLGYHVAALDLNLDARDGLGALRMNTPRQRAAISPVRADFHALPFPDGAFDFAVFNASLHYSADPYGAIEETMRVLRPEGVLYIMDSPLYRDHNSGDKMIAERRYRFQKQFEVDVRDEFTGSFLTTGMLETLEKKYCLEKIVPDYGLRWASRPVFARILGKREPASFGIIALSRSFKR